MKDYPQHAIDTLPDGFEIIGWGNPSDPHRDAHAAYTEETPKWFDGDYDGNDPTILYARRILTQPTSPLPTNSAERKTFPVYSGFVKYFPNAIAAVAHHSWVGNQQHHPDKPLHWDMDKSSDELDALMRHILEEDWEAVAWRAMANLERKLTGKCQYEKENER